MLHSCVTQRWQLVGHVESTAVRGGCSAVACLSVAFSIGAALSHYVNNRAMLLQGCCFCTLVSDLLLYVSVAFCSHVLSLPTNNNQVWTDGHKRARGDPGYLTLWRPVAPAGYVAMGLLASTGGREPASMSQVGCVPAVDDRCVLCVCWMQHTRPHIF